jgi:pimeloyl-ACP methyl ester carboxylesterase
MLISNRVSGYCTVGRNLPLPIQIVLGGFLLYLAYCCLLFLLQRQMVFPRAQAGEGVVAPPVPGLKVIWLDMPFGKVEAWFLPPQLKEEPAPAVIFAHGNTELIDIWPGELQGFTRLGMGLLLVEYPGYGRSEGSPSQQTITDTFIAAYDTLVARKDVDPSRIVLCGRSLGGGAVCALAARRSSAALILMSTFTSIRALAARRLVPGFLVLDPFDNLSVVSSYAGPVLVVHGKRDSLIPHTHGGALSRAAPQGRLITYEAGHNTMPPNWDVFWQDVEAFLRHTGMICAG